MKKLTLVIASAFVLTSAVSAATANVKVFACVPEWAALATAIGGERVEVTLATSALDNPESMTPTPGMISALQAADMIVCTGAGLEDTWLPAMLDRAANPKVAEGQPGHFITHEFVELHDDEVEGADDGDHGHAHMHEEGNPHIQGDPNNMRTVAAQLAKRLIELDPEGSDVYSSAVKSFIADLGVVIKELEATAAPLRGVHIAVQHEHSLYLLKWLGIETAATVEPEPGIAPGPAHLAEIIQAVPEEQIKFVIHAAYEDPGPSKYVAERAGIPLIKVPFTVGGTPGATDIFSFYRDTVERLLDGLNGRERT